MEGGAGDEEVGLLFLVDVAHGGQIDPFPVSFPSVFRVFFPPSIFSFAVCAPARLCTRLDAS